MLLEDEYDADDVLRDKFDEEDPVLREISELDFENHAIDPFVDLADESGDANDLIEP